MARRMKSAIHQDYLRSMMFGFEDALVSTTGVVVGISAGSADRSIVLLASIVTVAVEAVSMGAGQYLSEKAVHQLQKSKLAPWRHRDSVVFGAGIMFIAYAAAGVIPILPVILFPFPFSAIFSVVFAFSCLFLLGLWKGKLVGVRAFRSGWEMLAIGGVAALVGAVAGLLLKT